MKKLFKIFSISMLVVFPVTIFAQGKIASNSKDSETIETLQIAPCTAPADSVSPIKGVGVVIKKGGSSQSERTVPGEQNNPVTPNVTSSDALKTRTKSNNTNERGVVQLNDPTSAGQNNPVDPNVTSSDGQKTKTKSNNANDRTVQNKCIEPDVVDAKKPIIFKFQPGGNAAYNIRIYQLKEDQNYSNGVIAEKIIFEKTLSNVEEFTLDSLMTSVQPPYRTNFVWQIQAVDSQGKGTGEKQYGWIKASFEK